MPTDHQLAFPFDSLDFNGFTILTVGQIATKLRYTIQHILNLIEQGELVAIEGKSKGATRRECRIPLEAYRNFVFARMTGEHRRDFIHTLPRNVRLELLREIKESLAA